MDKNGMNAMMVINQMKVLYAEISALLQAADVFMLKEGWEPAAGNTSVQWSYHIGSPHQWIPQDVFRFYKHKTIEHLLSFISVILIYRENESEVEEPLLSCGFFDYGYGNQVGNDWSYELAHIHIDQDECEYDGQLMPLDDKYIDNCLAGNKVIRSMTMAMPLMDIGSSAELKARVIAPLLEGVKGGE